MDTRARFIRPTSHACCCVLLIFFAGISATIAEQLPEQDEAPLGLPALEHSAGDTKHEDKARLGERLFFDKRLSVDGRISCGSCHVPALSFSDRLPRSQGHAGSVGTRNAPSLLNVAYASSLFWDGRAPDLASQARAPFTNPVEHALPDEAALLRIVRDDASYAEGFARIFSVARSAIDIHLITDALIAYERTLLAADSPFDRYFYGKDRSAMSAQAIRGLEIFRGRANCVACHSIGPSSSLLTDQAFHVAARGLSREVTEDLATLARKVAAAKTSADKRALELLIATDPHVAALGRFVVTLEPADMGKFKTPSLRNVALTAPYMHDGNVATLEEAVDLELYSRGVVTYPIVLTRSEASDLIEFLRALSGSR